MKLQKIETNIGSPEILWRYIDIHKFISLIHNNTLLFTRLDIVSDFLEGINYEIATDLLRAKTLPDASDLNPLLGQDVIAESIALKIKSSENFQKKLPEEQKKRFASCWFNGNRESSAMWSIYSDPNSVALSIKLTDILEILEASTCEEFGMENEKIVQHGPIKYLPINPFEQELVDEIQKKGNLYLIGFTKDLCYSHESEYRFLVYNSDKTTENIKHLNFVLPSSFKKKVMVYTHPAMEEWKRKNIKSLCNKYGLNEPLKSEIIIR